MINCIRRYLTLLSLVLLNNFVWVGLSYWCYIMQHFYSKPVIFSFYFYWKICYFWLCQILQVFHMVIWWLIFKRTKGEITHSLPTFFVNSVLLCQTFFCCTQYNGDSLVIIVAVWMRHLCWDDHVMSLAYDITDKEALVAGFRSRHCVQTL